MTAKAQKLKSIAEWDALARRYPLGSRGDLVRQLALTVVSNVVVAHLLITRQMLPFHLVVLVALEALLLSVIAFVQHRFVPRSAIMESPEKQSIGQRIFTLGFGLFWLFAVYGLVLSFLAPSGDAVRDFVRDPLAGLIAARLHWPLAITAGSAVWDAVRDHLHWQQEQAPHGGYFVSTPGFNAIARWLTLFLGGIPYLMPLAIVVFGLSKLIQRLGKKAAAANQTNVKWALLVAPLLGLALFGTMSTLLRAGLAGWAIGYTVAKIASEVLIVFMPWIATQAKAEESAALSRTTSPNPGANVEAAPAKPRKRRRS